MPVHEYNRAVSGFNAPCMIQNLSLVYSLLHLRIYLLLQTALQLRKREIEYLIWVQNQSSRPKQLILRYLVRYPDKSAIMCVVVIS